MPWHPPIIAHTHSLAHGFRTVTHATTCVLHQRLDARSALDDKCFHALVPMTKCRTQVRLAKQHDLPASTPALEGRIKLVGTNLASFFEFDPQLSPIRCGVRIYSRVGGRMLASQRAVSTLILAVSGLNAQAWRIWAEELMPGSRGQPWIRGTETNVANFGNSSLSSVAHHTWAPWHSSQPLRALFCSCTAHAHTHWCGS